MEKQQNKKPLVRFPKFKDDWEYKRFEDFLIYTPRPKEKPKSNYLSIGLRSHFKGTFQKPDTDPNKNAMDTLYEIKENDFLVNITFAWEGALAIVPKADDGGFVSHRFPTYTFENEVDNMFFKYHFFKEKSKHQLGVVSPGGAGRNRVMNKTDFVKLKLPFPTLPEQQKIAHFFTTLDKKIDQLQEKKNALEKYKKGMMQKLFSKELRFKDDNGKDYPDWEVKRLGEVSANIMYGMNASATTFDGKNKYLRITDIDENTRTYIPNPITSPQGLIEDKYKLSEGDIVFTRTGASVGKSYLYDKKEGDLFFAGFLIRFAIKKGNPNFMYYQTLTEKYNKWVITMSMRSGQPGLNANEYKEFEIVFPSIQEQNKIANFLSKIENKISAVNEQIEQTKTYKKGLLQKMFV